MIDPADMDSYMHWATKLVHGGYGDSMPAWMSAEQTIYAAGTMDFYLRELKNSASRA